jgi:hypothetical protein
VSQSDHLAAAVSALQEHRVEEAIRLLTDALDGGLSPTLKARATSLRSQAHFMSDMLQEAMVDWRDAWRQVQSLEDADGKQALRGLRSEIAAAKAQRSAHNAQVEKSRQNLSLSLDEQLASFHDIEDKLNFLIERANAHFDCDQTEDGTRFARDAILEADSTTPSIVRAQVLARLCLLRGTPEDAQSLLQEAYLLAEKSDEMQLIGAVARAAKTISHEFEPVIF